MNYFENSVLVWDQTTFYDASSFEKRESAARIILDEFYGSKNYDSFYEKRPYPNSLSPTNQMTMDMSDEEIASYPQHVQSTILRAKQRIRKEQKSIAELNGLVFRHNAVHAIFDEEYDNDWFTFKATKRWDSQPMEDFEKLFERIKKDNPRARMVTRNIPHLSHWIEEPWTNMQVIVEMQDCGVFENFGNFEIFKVVNPATSLM